MVVPHLSFFWLTTSSAEPSKGMGREETLQATSLQLLYAGLPIVTVSAARPSSRTGEESVRPAGPWSNLWLGGTAEAVPSHEFFNSDRGPESGCRFTCA